MGNKWADPVYIVDRELTGLTAGFRSGALCLHSSADYMDGWAFHLPGVRMTGSRFARSGILSSEFRLAKFGLCVNHLSGEPHRQLGL